MSRGSPVLAPPVGSSVRIRMMCTGRVRFYLFGRGEVDRWKLYIFFRRRRPEGQSERLGAALGAAPSEESVPTTTFEHVDYPKVSTNQMTKPRA